MLVTISLFWVVFGIIIVHTIIQHLLNWAARAASDANEAGLVFFGYVLEFMVLVAVLVKLFVK